MPRRGVSVSRPSTGFLTILRAGLSVSSERSCSRCAVSELDSVSTDLRRGPFSAIRSRGVGALRRLAADLEQRLRTEDEHPVPAVALGEVRSLMRSLALILHLIDGVDAGWSLSENITRQARDHNAAGTCPYWGRTKSRLQRLAAPVDPVSVRCRSARRAAGRTGPGFGLGKCTPRR
jgi:hypothetical protein